MSTLKEIPASLTYAIRQELLRPGRPPEECIFPGDTAASTFHLGVYDDDDSLVAVASYMRSSSEKFIEKDQYQLRGMAVLQQFKNKGLGAMLLLGGEDKIRSMERPYILWFNARGYAVGFYEKYGYKTIGGKFVIPGVCEHIIMYKYL